MFFRLKSPRSFFVIVIALSQGLLLSACDRFLKNADKSSQTQDSVKIEFKDGACLKDVPVEVGKFFKDQSHLSPSTSCIKKALKSFMDLTRGADARYYTATELKDFFNDYLLKENKIDADFLKDIMKIKVLIAGGSPDVATREELEKFNEFLAEFGAMGDELHGMMQIVTLKAPLDSVDLVRLQDFKTKVRRIAEFILLKTQLTTSGYQINDLNLFLEHLRKFIAGTNYQSHPSDGSSGSAVKGQSTELEDLFKWLPLINMSRELLIGDAARLQTQKDWVETKDWLIGAYMTFLKYHFVIEHQSFDTPAESSLLIGFLDEVFSLIEKSPILKEKKIFEAAKIDTLIDELVKQRLLVIALPIPLLKESYRKALVYFIDSISAAQDLGSFRGVTDSHVLALKAEYNIWKASQNLLIRAFLELNSAPTLRTLLEFQKSIDGKGFPLVPTNDREEYNRAWWDFYGLLNRPFPVIHDEQLRLIVSPTAPEAPLSFRGLTQTNLIRTITRMILRGYGNRQERAIYKRAIKEEDFVRLEKDFHDFAVETGLVDPDKKTSGQETFDQGKMLVFSSNGDGQISSAETTELFATLFSGGKTILNLIYSDLAASGCTTQQTDVFRMPWVNEACFYSQLRLKVAQYFPNIPLFSKFVQGLSDAQFAAWYQSTLKVAKSSRHRQGLLESGEIRTMAAIFHFVDEIYLTYDTNRSGLLSESEVTRAYPRFEGVIVKQAEKNGFLASLIPESIFIYLVYNGEIPGSMDIFMQWGQQITGGLGEVNRLKIFKLLATMKEVLDAENLKNLPLDAVKVKGQALLGASSGGVPVTIPEKPRQRSQENLSSPSPHFGERPVNSEAPLEFLDKKVENQVTAPQESSTQQGQHEPTFLQRIYQKASAFIQNYFSGL